MKEDYLWDKTGSDPEIERLENALRAFRYVETEPPALPAKIVPFEKKTARGFFRLAFAFGACAALVIVSFGVWFQFAGERTEVVKDSPVAIAPPIIEEVSDEVSPEKPKDSIVEKVESPKRFVERETVKVKKSVPAIARPNKIVAARNDENKKPSVELTNDEKYAYRQLMLALSITSSKFKMVRDKVENVEADDAVRRNER